MNKLIFVLTVVFGQAAFGQEHLVPANDYYSAYQYQHRYYSLVRQRLIGDLNERVVARVIVLPSFEPEYVVTVDSSRKGYFLLYRTFEKSIWYAQNKVVSDSMITDNVLGKVEFRKSISEKLAKLLNVLFFDLASKARYPDFVYETFRGKKTRMISIGTDGTTYNFMAFGSGFGIRCGETWSPKTGSLMDELVKVSDLMVSVAQEGSPESRLQEAAEALHNKIQKDSETIKK